jgi:hypothetical protein
MIEVPVKYRPEEVEERRLRIKLSVAAYAYEYEDDSIISDAEFDTLCKKVNLEQGTGYKALDNYFKKQFKPDTGMWIRKHPDKAGLTNLYYRYYKDKNYGTL